MPVRDDDAPCALVLHHSPCHAHQEASKRLRLIPQAALPHGTAVAPVLPAKLIMISPDHDRLSVRQTAATAASGKPVSRAAAGYQATRPPRGQSGKSARQRQDSTTSQTKHSTRKRPKRVSVIATLDTIDPLRETTRKTTTQPSLGCPGTCKDDLRTR